MAINERDWTHLRDASTEALGAEAAQILMAALEGLPDDVARRSDLDRFATKEYLEANYPTKEYLAHNYMTRGELEVRFDAVDRRLVELRQDMHTGFTEIRQDLRDLRRQGIVQTRINLATMAGSITAAIAISTAIAT
jgi:hypothetical protein